MDQEGRCWPAHDTIAAAAGYSVPTVRRGIVALERAGLLDRELGGGRRLGTRDQGRPNTYTARIPDHVRSRIERIGDQAEADTCSSAIANLITGDHRSSQEVSREGSASEPEDSPPVWAGPPPWVTAGLTASEWADSQ
jgi:hypothetical protein